jgi:hypothetical protein
VDSIYKNWQHTSVVSSRKKLTTKCGMSQKNNCITFHGYFCACCPWRCEAPFIHRTHFDHFDLLPCMVIRISFNEGSLSFYLRWRQAAPETLCVFFVETLRNVHRKFFHNSTVPLSHTCRTTESVKFCTLLQTFYGRSYVISYFQ